VILVLDNYDSFTWNIVHYLRELGETVRVERSDGIGSARRWRSGAEAFLISPGPGRRRRPGSRSAGRGPAPKRGGHCSESA
jgi:anthranilate synthase component 2